MLWKRPRWDLNPPRSVAAATEHSRLLHEDKVSFQVAQVGFEPTASLVLSQGGLPVAYRAACAQTRSRTSNRPGLSRAALPVGVSGRSSVVPDGVEPSFPVCRTGVVAVGPRDCAFKWTHWESHPDLKRAELVSSSWTMSPSRRKPWDSNPQSRFIGTAVFGTASSSGRMTSDRAAAAGIEPASGRLTGAFPYQHGTHRNTMC